MKKVGKWIVLVCKLPTEVSPPKLSIFYSTPWGLNIARVKKTWKEYKGQSIEREFELNKAIIELEGIKLIRDMMGNHVPNEVGARAILYKGERIKVWPHEYTFMKQENWEEYYPTAYDLVPDTEAQSKYLDIVFSKSAQKIFEAALVDGCTDFQALQAATGSEVNSDPAPVGWFKIKQEYGRIFCREWELKAS